MGKKTKKIFYTEGWVEFMNKRHAKRCAEMLNNRKVGGKRHNFHYEDLWNIKYLHKFKWPQLTQKIGAWWRCWAVSSSSLCRCC